MQELKTFFHQQFGEIRTIEINEQLYFVGNDIAVALGYLKPRNAIQTHCRCALKQGVPHPQNPTKVLEIIVIPEGDVYRLIARSKLPGAEKFESWIFDEIMPSIRKHGAYMTEATLEQALTSPDFLIQLATQLKEEKNKRLQAEVRVSQLAVENQILIPKAKYFDELVDRKLLTNFRTTALELNIKEKDFIKQLIDKKYVYRDARGTLLPYANKNDGLFEAKECYNEKTQWKGVQTLITPRGRETFRLLLTQN